MQKAALSAFTLIKAPGKEALMIDKIDHILNTVIKFITFILLAILTLLVVYTVVLRYIFNSGFPAGEELSRYLFVWSAFMGIILGVKAKSHMCLTFLSDKFPKLRPLTTTLYYLCSYVFFGIVSVYGIRFTVQASTARSTLLPITMNYVYAAVPFCSIACIIVLTGQLIHEFDRSDPSDGKEART